MIEQVDQIPIHYKFSFGVLMKPSIAQKAPYPVAVQAGTSYYWCSCGKSQNQPFCDGSHHGTDLTPVKYEAIKNKTVYFCGCKQSKKIALCDGTHKSL
jgi:CDGSH-type Zn-finger protein